MYQFSDDELHAIYDVHSLSPFGPTIAYREFVLGGDSRPLVSTDDVEGWICAFYSAYNSRVRPGTF